MPRRRRKPNWTPETAVVGPLDRRGRATVAAGEGGRPREARVDGALPGEEVEFLRCDREGPIDAARTLAVLRPAAERVAPRCRHYGVCGGCSLMHLDPAAQIGWKQALLLDDFARHGLAPERVLAPLRADEWRYRRRARLGAKWVPGKDKVVVGFREKDRRFIADLETCEILHAVGGSAVLGPGGPPRGPASPPPPADTLAGPQQGPLAAEPGRLIPLLSQLVGGLSIAAKLPQIEVSVGDDRLALVLRTLEPASEADRARLREFAEQHRVQIFLQPGGLDSVAPLEPGDDPLLRYALPEFEVELRFSPTDFVQVNAALNRAMVRQAIELLELEPEHRVLDLFCGLGNFSLPLARRAREVLAVEGDAGLVARARQNAEANAITNVRFEQRDLYVNVGELDWLDGRFDRVLLDPPRSGAEGIVARFDRVAAPRVVYVACSPETLARDAAILVERHGYRLAAAGVMDMFPHTAHVESIAVFER